MPGDLTFIGEVTPVFASRDLVVDQRWKVGLTSYQTQVEVVIQVIAGVCAVTFVSPSPALDPADLYGVARRLALLCLDYAAFRTQVPLQLTLTTRLGAGGVVTVIAPQVDGIQMIDEGQPIEPHQWRALIEASTPAQNALRDYRHALSEPDETAFFLHRCLECMRHEFEAGGATRGEAWSRMQSALNYDRTWTGAVEAAGTAQRHGQHEFATHEERVESLVRVGRVLNRFLHWLEDGRSTLSESTFPRLP